MRKLGLAAALAALVFAGPLSSLAAGESPDHKSLEALLVEFANTPQEHLALAGYYRGKAADARGAAVEHRAMAKHYASGKLLQRDAMKAHCEGLAKQFDAAAAEYEQLAAGHDAEAKR